MNRVTDDLISRTILIDELMAGCMPIDLPGLSGVTGDKLTIRNYIDSAPSVDAMPVIYGRWVEKRWITECDWCVINHRALMCTACSIEIADGEKTPYCPYCGARMETKNA